MHIGLWSPAWPLESHHNGIVTYAHWMQRGLQELGHRVTIFTRTLEAASAHPGVQQVRLSRWHRLRHRLAGHGVERRIFDFDAAIVPAIARVHRRDRLDILEMEESFGWFHAIQRRTGLPMVVKLHGPAFLSLVGDELDSPFGRDKIEREGAALRRAQVIVSPTRRTLEQTLRHYGLTPPATRCIANPLALADEAPLWRLDGCERHTLLFVGRFDERKGADVLLQAFATLLAHRPRLRLVFVGPDLGLPDALGRRIYFSEYCRRLLGAEGLRAVDYRGALSTQQIARLRARCYLTIVASRWENQGYALLEAMLQGCPLVCSDAGGCPESITHGVTGHLAASGDPAAFTRAIATLLDDPAAAQRLGAAARDYVLTQHAPRRVAAETVEFYQSVISSTLDPPRLH